MIEKWRFPASLYGEKKGISSGDSEIFRKNPIKAFAREILQNSIDARNSDEVPTRVEFKTFEIDKNQIPGVNELIRQIKLCKQLWASKEDYIKVYDEYLKVLEKSKIKCLRISDFNTTGLIGVETDDQENNKFLALTKGSGVSEKGNSLAAGSKGVGKNAAYYMSEIKTVFYTTRTNQDTKGNPTNKVGSFGVADFISGCVAENDKDYTQGKGYFSNCNENKPILEFRSLDKTFSRKENEFGTDIYIIGFDEKENWVKDIVNSVLESFLPAIYFQSLAICIENIEITKDSLEDIVYNENLIYPKNKSEIISQFRLLSPNEAVSIYDIDTDYGSCQLSILALAKDEEELATHKCVMVRYPYMKIKDLKLSNNFRVSAMCIIADGKLGQKLREIENAQHIDWEPKRIKNSYQRQEIENVIKSIREQIREKVIECLRLGDDRPLDPYGAGDFLPDTDFGEANNNGEGSKKILETVTISKIKQNDTYEKNAKEESVDGKSLQPDIGNFDESEDGTISHPEGSNDVIGGGNRPGSGNSLEKEGDEVVFKKQKLAGVRYKVISTDKEKGTLRIIFISPIDFKTSYLNIKLLDDTNKSTKINIKNMMKNGKSIESNDSDEYGPFEISFNEKVILDVEIDRIGFFGCEVKVICK